MQLDLPGNRIVLIKVQVPCRSIQSVINKSGLPHLREWNKAMNNSSNKRNEKQKLSGNLNGNILFCVTRSRLSEFFCNKFANSKLQNATQQFFYGVMGCAQ